SGTTSVNRSASGRCAHHVVQPPPILPCTRTTRGPEPTVSTCTQRAYKVGRNPRSQATSRCYKLAMLPADGARLAPDVRARRSRRDPHRRHGGGRRDRRARRLGARLPRDRMSHRRGRRHPRRDLLRVSPLPRGLLVRSALFTTPRPVPNRVLPALGGALVLVLALPVFLVAGWRVGGWAIAAVLWLA